MHVNIVAKDCREPDVLNPLPRNIRVYVLKNCDFVVVYYKSREMYYF